MTRFFYASIYRLKASLVQRPRCARLVICLLDRLPALRRCLQRKFNISVPPPHSVYPGFRQPLATRTEQLDAAGRRCLARLLSPNSSNNKVGDNANID